MRKRYLFWSGLALLAILLTLVVWQVSFSFGEYGPADAAQTFVFWAVSTLIFLLTVTLGFMLFRTGVKLYLERQANREGSRIKTKLLAGALALSLLPVVFLVLFSYVILNRNVEKWFSRPAEGIRTDLVQSSRALSAEVQGRAKRLARWIASLPEVDADGVNFAVLCRENNIASLEIRRPGAPPNIVCPLQPGTTDVYVATAPLRDGTLVLAVRSAIDLQKTQSEIDRYMAEYNQLAAQKKNIRTMYLLFILVIALFILFVATWIALLLSRQISVADFGAAGRGGRGAQGQSGPSRHAPSHRRTGDAGARLQRNDAGTGSQQPRAREPPPLHRSDSRKHSHRRDLADRRRPHPARESRAAGAVSAGASGARRAPGRSVSARRRGRNSLPDEARPPHRRRRQPDRAADVRPRCCIWP